MINNIIILLRHDLSVAFKNKTFYLIVGIPLFVYASLMLIDSSEARVARVKIALIRTELYSPAMLESINAASDQFSVLWTSDEEEAMRLLKQRDADGILWRAEGGRMRLEAKEKAQRDEDGSEPAFGEKSEGDAPRLQLTVMQQASISTLNILQRFSALQTAVEGKNQSWIAAVRPLQTSSIKRQTLPTWILMMVLLISFIVLPTQVAEEKERQLLLGWMQTPARESEWLVSKLVYGIVLLLASVVALQFMDGEPACSHGMSYLAMLCAGGFCFGSLGICLGLLCCSQASARTLGVLCYLPMLLPAALSDMSQELRNIALWVPSYYFHEPIRAMLLEDSGAGSFVKEWISLLAIGLVACLVSRQLIKKRWLM